MNIKHLPRPDKHVYMDEAEIHQALTLMEQDVSLKTVPGYRLDVLEPIRLVSFREKHLTYLKAHPKVNPEHYLSNLRTMIKIRPR